MGYEEHIAEMISIDKFTPAVGQGSVALECAVSLDSAKKVKIRELCNHAETEQQLLAERAFLRRLQGGCSIPVFGLSQKSGALTGGIVSLDGAEILKETIIGINPEEIGKELAERILSLGGDRILKEIKANL